MNDDCDPMVIGVATTKDKAQQMIEKSKETFEDAFEYEIVSFEKNVIIIDGVKYSF